MTIGLTGSMAAGKSTVSRLLKERGFFIVDADELSREAFFDPDIQKGLIALFGDGIIAEDGTLDRAAVAAIAFSSRENTEKLNALMHPIIIKRMLELSETIEAKLAPATVFDVPLLFESGFDKYCDKVLVVAASDETRYLRIMLRDGLSREQAAQRVNKQMPQEEKLARADVSIMNDGTAVELEQKLDEALELLGFPIKKTRNANSLPAHSSL